MQAVKALVSELGAIRDGLTAHARLSALALLAEERLERQRDRARDAVVRIEQAAQLAELMQRCFGVRQAPVAWSDAERGEVARMASRQLADVGDVQPALDARLAQIAARVASVQRWCSASPLAAAVALQLDGLAASLPAAQPARRRAPRVPQPPPEPRQSLRGPQHVRLDPLFRPTFSLLDRPDLLVAKSQHESAPFYWLAGLRESMAAQLCALSMVETCGLPLAFHRDFAKQAWDEMRHALFFVDVGRELLPEFLARAPRSHPLRAGALRFQRTGRGLPCPVERNLYEVAFAATLPQRLVLMHLDTETPGISRFKRELRSPFWRSRPRLSAGLQLSTADEGSHARLGRTWLQHLLPDREQRRAEIARTRVLRGALLLAACSHYHRAPVAELIRGVTRRARAA